jgi:pyruvate dehydrogenase (quinone)
VIGRRTIAEQLIEVLRQVGVARIYGVVDLVTDPNALSIPPHLTASQVKGFALATGKIVLDGGVGRMVELARANVRNIPRPPRGSASPVRSSGSPA